MTEPPARFCWLRYAYFGRDSKSAPNELDTEWVGVLREMESDGCVEYCVEHLDSNFNEICPDECFAAEAEAQAHADVENYAVTISNGGSSTPAHPRDELGSAAL